MILGDDELNVKSAHLVVSSLSQQLHTTQ